MKQDASLRLHIPESHFRPGDVPDFDYLDLPKAGDATRPEVDAKASATRDLAYGLVRVIDDSIAAIGPWDPKLDPEILRRGLRAMLLTRIFDDRMFKAQRQGKQKNNTDQEAHHMLCLKFFRIFIFSFGKDPIEAVLFKPVSKYLCHQCGAVPPIHAMRSRLRCGIFSPLN